MVAVFSHKTSAIIIIFMQILRHREIKWLSQGQTVSQRQNQWINVSLNSGAMMNTSSPRFLNLRLHVLSLSGFDVPASNLVVSLGEVQPCECSQPSLVGISMTCMRLLMATLFFMGQLTQYSCGGEGFRTGCVFTWYPRWKWWEGVRQRLSCMPFHR